MKINPIKAKWNNIIEMLATASERRGVFPTKSTATRPFTLVAIFAVGAVSPFLAGRFIVLAITTTGRAEKNYLLAMALLFCILAVSSWFAAREAKNDQPHRPYQLAAGIIILLIFLVSYFNPVNF